MSAAEHLIIAAKLMLLVLPIFTLLLYIFVKTSKTVVATITNIVTILPGKTQGMNLNREDSLRKFAPVISYEFRGQVLKAQMMSTSRRDRFRIGEKKEVLILSFIPYRPFFKQGIWNSPIAFAITTAIVWIIGLVIESSS